MIAPLTLAAFNVQWLESRWKDAKATLFTKPTLLLLRQLWKAVDPNDYVRNRRVSWWIFPILSKGFILMGLAEWHSRLLKGLIDYSTRTVPENMRGPIKKVTDPGIPFNRGLGNLGYEILGLRELRNIYPSSDNIQQPSIYGDDDEQKTTRLQVQQDVETILHIVERFGLLTRYSSR